MNEPMTDDELKTLRNQIWDYVYRQGTPQSIDAIVQDVNQTDAEVRRAIEHDWFVFNDDLVAIA